MTNKMKVQEAVSSVEHALANPVTTWPNYDLTRIPFVVYDTEDALFFQHPNPPAERPERLSAATATDINGVQTATIPTELWPDADQLVPVLYHEGFHVYQNTDGFKSADKGFDFFRALASYPELHGEYRALCRAEAEILNLADDLEPSSSKRAAMLGALVRRKFALLDDNLRKFDNYLERFEGTASFVEGLAREKIYGIAPGHVESAYGWARQYTVGAAVCRFLESLMPGAWQPRVEAGESPSDILLADFGDAAADLTALHLEDKIASETETAARILAEHEAKIAAMNAAETLRIQFPPDLQIMRAFNPSTMAALGDGRLLHTDFLKLFVPAGKVEITGLALENHVTHELTFRAVPYTFENGVLRADADGVVIELSNIQQQNQQGTTTILTLT